MALDIVTLQLAKKFAKNKAETPATTDTVGGIKSSTTPAGTPVEGGIKVPVQVDANGNAYITMSVIDDPNGIDGGTATSNP